MGKDRDQNAERVDDKPQREMIATAAQRTKLTQPPAPERVFDFSFAQKVGETLM